LNELAGSVNRIEAALAGVLAGLEYASFTFSTQITNCPARITIFESSVNGASARSDTALVGEGSNNIGAAEQLMKLRMGLSAEGRTLTAMKGRFAGSNDTPSIVMTKSNEIQAAT